jgi:hypothetical protein
MRRLVGHELAFVLKAFLAAEEWRVPQRRWQRAALEDVEQQQQQHQFLQTNIHGLPTAATFAA